jgi:hypothetical protein
VQNWSLEKDLTFLNEAFIRILGELSCLNILFRQWLMQHNLYYWVTWCLLLLLTKTLQVDLQMGLMQHFVSSICSIVIFEYCTIKVHTSRLSKKSTILIFTFQVDRQRLCKWDSPVFTLTNKSEFHCWSFRLNPLALSLYGLYLHVALPLPGKQGNWKTRSGFVLRVWV